MNVGEPGAEASEDHLVGLVAEALWYELRAILDVGSGAPVLVEAHDWSVIDHGGDGLAVYRVDGEFGFPVVGVEVAARSAAREIRDTVNGACRQLRDHTPDYLGRFAVVSQHIVDDDDLARFICGIADEWADASPAAGMGICITASPGGDPTMCSERLPEYFEFEDDKHGGRLSVVADLPGFSQKIRQVLAGIGVIERALDFKLSAALGEHRRLPDPSDLQRRLTDAEIALFTQAEAFDDDVLDAGWYLHAVAWARDDLGVYETLRRRQARRVAAHIFDLHLQHRGEELRGAERLRYVFASQVGYIGGELTPNAAAVRVRKSFERIDLSRRTAARPGESRCKLEPCCWRWTDRRSSRTCQDWRRQLGALSTNWPTVEHRRADVDGVIRGCWDLLLYFVYSRGEEPRIGHEPLSTARWSAKHRVPTSIPVGWLRTCSIWLATWELVLFGRFWAGPWTRSAGHDAWRSRCAAVVATAGRVPLAERPPLDPTTRRLALSFPTSAGKTMLSQLIVLAPL